MSKDKHRRWTRLVEYIGQFGGYHGAAPKAKPIRREVRKGRLKLTRIHPGPGRHFYHARGFHHYALGDRWRARGR